MATNLNNLYVYLARRDKTGVRLLVILEGRPILPARLENIETLNLSISLTNQLVQTIYDSRMLWEPWIESSGSFDEFRDKLKVRGFTNVPLNPQPEIFVTPSENRSANLSSFPKKETMIRKS